MKRDGFKNMPYHLVYFQRDSFLHRSTWVLRRNKMCKLATSNDTHGWRASGGYLVVKVNLISCDLCQIQLKIHYWTVSSVGTRHKFGEGWSSLELLLGYEELRATALGLAGQCLARQLPWTREATLVDPTLCQALCKEKTDPRGFWL